MTEPQQGFRARAWTRAVLVAGATAAGVTGLLASPARAQDEPPPPPLEKRAPPPRPEDRPKVVDPTAPGFRGAVLGDLSDQQIVEATNERVLVAVGGVAQPIWIKQPGLELRADSVVLWGHRDRVVEALQAREDLADAPPEQLLGPVLHAVYAEGGVVLRRDGQVVRAERVFVDFAQNRAYMVQAEMTGSVEGPDRTRIPLRVRAEVIRGITREKFRAENPSFTTCTYEKPHYRFTTDWIEVDFRQDYGAFETAWWPTLRADTLVAEDQPLLVLPKLGGTTLSAGPLRKVGFSGSSRFGTTAELTWGGTFKRADGSRWGDWQVETDWRSHRGPGVGLSVEHESQPARPGGRPNELELDAYWQRDTASEDDFSERAFDGRVNGDTDDDRGRAHLWYRHFLEEESAVRLFGQGWRIDTSVAWWSDRGYLPEYEERLAYEEDQQSTHVHARNAWGNHGLSILSSYRIPATAAPLVRSPFGFLMDDYAPQTDYLPSVTWHLINEPIIGFERTGLFPVNLSVQANAANVRRSFDERGADFLENTLDYEGDSVRRGDIEARVTTPFSLGPIRVNPFFGATNQAQSEQNGLAFAGTGEDEAEDRHSGFAGIRVDIEAHRAWACRNDMLDLDGLRHVVSLDGQWLDRFKVSEDPYTFQHNDLIDELVEQNVGSIRLRNRIQTRRGGEVVDLLDYEARFLHYFEKSDATPMFLGVREDYPQPLQLLDFPGEEKYRAMTRDGSAFHQHRARLQVLRNLWLVGEADYDMQRNEMESSAAGVRWFVDDRLSFYAGRRMIDDDSTIVTLRGDYRLSEKWAFGVEHQEDTRADRTHRTRLTLFRRAHDYTIAVEFQSERLLGETSISLAIYPNDWLRSSDDPFSMRRPLDYSALRWYR